MQGFLTAEAAAERLGIRRETLYAYVSRRLIQSKQSPDGRSRLYSLEDIERLEQRKEQRRRPSQALKEALHFGSPLLESALTLIQQGRIFYRGRDAVELSRTKSLEEVAAWLWLEDFGAAGDLFSDRSRVPASALKLAAELDRPWSVESLQILVPTLAQADPRAWIRQKPREIAAAGARLLQQVVELAISRSAAEPEAGLEAKGIADRLAAAWSPHAREPAGQLLSAALILCADHELNVSSFTARCVASAGSPIHSAVGAGLAALHGSLHGGHTRRVEALLREARDPEGVLETVQQRLQRDEPIPGYGQVLYPEGDPRYQEVMGQIARLFPDSKALHWAAELESVGRELLGEHPTVDVSLALIAETLALPRDGALTLFALGRTVGWVGHALEQYAQGRLIRPRARYVGEPPQ